MDLQEKLTRCIDARFPIIYIKSYEELRTDEIIAEASDSRKLIEWNGADGLVDFETKTPLSDGRLSLEETLAYLLDDPESDGIVLVLKDSQIYLGDEYPTVTALLKKMCRRIIKGDIEASVIIVSQVIRIPKEIEQFVTLFEDDIMYADDIRRCIQEYTAELTLPAIEKDLLNDMVSAFRGMTRYEIESVINLALSENGEISRADIKLAAEHKRQILKKNNILEMVDVTENIDDIGGMNSLKQWLERKAAIFKNIDRATAFGADIPKGVLIAGFKGCGKSLMAKVTSKFFEVPLLKLGSAGIKGNYTGSTETDIQTAIRLAESVSPCILWIDEPEKAFKGNDGLLHKPYMSVTEDILSWLRKKKAPVFVVVTADDVTETSHELLDKSCFDDIFYVDLPDGEERRDIFDIHIRKRRPSDAGKIDSRILAEKTKGFCGADIEYVVRDAVENSFADGRKELTAEYLENSIKTALPLSAIMNDQYDRLSKFYKEKNYFRSAK